MEGCVARNFAQGLMLGRYDLAHDVIKVMLLTDAHAPDECHETVADVAGCEAFGNGYRRGGKELEGKRVEGGVLRADPVVWDNATVEARYAQLYFAATGDLICCVDGGAQEKSRESEFRVDWSPEGILIQ